MNRTSTQQEILLVIGNNFLMKDVRQTSDRLNCKYLTEKEKLKAACRDGLLPGMLPEILELHCINKKLHLWEMKEGSLFIELKPDKIPREVDLQFSIDPYSFLPVQILS